MVCLITAVIAQLGERSTEDAEVVRSIRTHGVYPIFFFFTFTFYAQHV
jgi:hypothetical protein